MKTTFQPTPPSSQAPSPYPGHPTAVKPRLRGVLHSFACAGALVAGSMLNVSAPTPQAKVACWIYTTTLVLLFGISTLYHRPTWKNPRARTWMRRLDHAAIFALIAGTYTPVCMLGLHDPLKRSLLISVWLGAAAGIVKSLVWIQAPKIVSVVLYLMLGWLLLPYGAEIAASLGRCATLLFLAGGLAYSAGAVIYALRRPNPIPAVVGYHEVFHALVVIAAFFHFSAVYKLVHAQT